VTVFFLHFLPAPVRWERDWARNKGKRDE